MPGPTLVTPILPVTLEPIERKEAALASQTWNTRSGAVVVSVPPASVTALAPTVGVIRIPPLAIVRPAVVSSEMEAASLKRSEWMASGEAPIVVSKPLLTLVPAA